MKKKNIIVLVVVLIVLLLGIFGYFRYKDSFKFSNEYGVNKFNNFSYSSLSDVFDMINDKKSGVVFLCYSGNSWCKEYAKVLNDASLDNGAKVYYVDIKNDMDNKSDSYNKLIDLLENKLHKDITGTEVLYVPYLMFIDKGTITSYDNETSLVVGDVSSSDYWSVDGIKNFNTRFKAFYKKIK